MKFTKMQGIGNDYVYVNGFEEKVENPEEVSKVVADRHFGIGGDGLIIIQPSDVADCRMDMYNADGSRGKMCGNGVRCVAKYVYDHGIAKKDVITVETLSGIRRIEVFLGADGKVDRARVNMGAPILEPAMIPATYQPGQNSAEGESPAAARAAAIDPAAKKMAAAAGAVVDAPYTVGGTEYCITLVSMGNPHCVVRVEDPAVFPLEKIGPMFEHAGIFPERVNTEFIRVDSRTHVTMRVWERGSGETLACGTGSCAVLAACVLNGWTERKATIALRGGDLEVDWDEQSGDIYMTGAAREVFHGEMEL